MATTVNQVDSRVSSSGINNHEKLPPSPSYERKDAAVENTDVKYGNDGVEEKDLGLIQSQGSEVGENDEEHRSFASRTWTKYKPFFHLLFMVVMTG
jgi:hypothetical protein